MPSVEKQTCRSCLLYNDDEYRFYRITQKPSKYSITYVNLLFDILCHVKSSHGISAPSTLVDDPKKSKSVPARKLSSPIFAQYAVSPSMILMGSQTYCSGLEKLIPCAAVPILDISNPCISDVEAVALADSSCICAIEAYARSSELLCLWYCCRCLCPIACLNFLLAMFANSHDVDISCNAASRTGRWVSLTNGRGLSV